MLRVALAAVLSVFVFAATGVSQVQTVGQVSFPVPDGWQYQAGKDVVAMVLKANGNFWVVAVYSPMPASGNADADFITKPASIKPIPSVRCEQAIPLPRMAATCTRPPA